MRRALLVAVGLTVTLTACGGGTKSTQVLSQPTPTPSPTQTATAGQEPTVSPDDPCVPHAGPKDLSKEPVYTVPKDLTPPTVTTNTDIVCGTGAQAKSGSDVTVQYVGVNFATGAVFDASWKSGMPFEFNVGSGVIPGFTYGVAGMKVGGRRLVVIPPADGYGSGGPVPNGTLAFYIDLLSVK